MSNKGQRAAAKTVLAWGSVYAPVALYKTTGKQEDLPEWDSAGPSGGVLRVRERAAAVPLREPEGDNPFALEVASLTEEPAAPEPEGQFRRVLVEEGTDREVVPEEVRRGLRRPDGRFVDLTDALRVIDERTRLEVMRVHCFIRVEQVQRERVLGSYYLAPSGGPEARALRLLYDAMRETRRVAVVKWTKSSRQALGVIAPHPATGTLVVLQMAWADQLREAPAAARAIQDVEVTERERIAAVALIGALEDTREALDELEDDAVVFRRELLSAAASGADWAPPADPEADPEADLAAALINEAERVTRAAA